MLPTLARAFMQGLTSANKPPPPVSPGLFHLPLHCSAFGGVSIIEAVCERGAFIFRRNVPPDEVGTRSDHRQAPAQLGRYRIDLANWSGCPRCGARGGVWQCTKKSGCGAFHCIGQQKQARGRLGACGQHCGISFEETTSFDVHGTAAPVRSNPALAAPPAATSLPAQLPPLLRLPPK